MVGAGRRRRGGGGGGGHGHECPRSHHQNHARVPADVLDGGSDVRLSEKWKRAGHLLSIQNQNLAGGLLGFTRITR